MTIVKSKPTSPGRRFRVKVSNKDLHKGQPYQPLLAKLNKRGGRNNQGRITTRHRGGGHKKHYRIIDFKRLKVAYLPKLKQLNMIQIDQQILHYCYTRMEKELT